MGLTVGKKIHARFGDSFEGMVKVLDYGETVIPLKEPIPVAVAVFELPDGEQKTMFVVEENVNLGFMENELKYEIGQIRLSLEKE